MVERFDLDVIPNWHTSHVLVRGVHHVQNHGKLAAGKRASQFAILSDAEVRAMEKAVQAAWGGGPWPSP